MLHAVIMAGGSGTRFWPASTEEHPKQFLSLFGKKTMLQNTVERIKPLIAPEQILVITNERYTKLVAEQLPAIPQKNIIGEPVGKDTAPCVGAAAAIIAERDGDATMAVLPADHLIKKNQAFLDVLQQAEQQAQQPDTLVTLGIKPRHAETGYGYIEFEKNGQSQTEARPVIQFREKPDEATAEQFVEAGNFLWNSGMFVWKAETIIDQFKKHLSEVYAQIGPLREKVDTASQQQAISTFYHACPSISIDYGIMERAEQVAVLPSRFGWNDVGDWKAFYDLSNKDEEGNAVQNDISVIKAGENNLIRSKSGKMIALAGVENVAVVETDNTLLVCNLDKAQEVKSVVNVIRADEELNEFL